MARFLQLDDPFYLNGVVNLRRGDDWILTGKVVDLIDGVYQAPVDLTGFSATGYFPNDPGVQALPVSAVFSFPNPTAGQFAVTVSNAATLGALPNTGGSSFYAVFLKSGQYSTYDSNGEPLVITDRVFNSF